MKLELDVYVAMSGPFRLAFVSAQIDATAVCPSFDVTHAARSGVLGRHEGMQIIHPAWFWGGAEMQQAPRHLLVLRSNACALAVDSYRLQRLSIAPAPAALSGRGIVYGVAHGPDGLTPILDLARVPLA